VNLVEEINERKRNGLFRTRRVIDSAQGPLIKIEEEEYLNFSSNDYLGLANNEELKDCMAQAINQYGVGAGSSQLVVGHSRPHQQLEESLSAFLKRDAALIFPTGYQANLAVASVMVDSNTIILQDKLNHASLIDAAQLSKGRLVRYRHKDTKHLENLLEKYKQHNLIVMTDGVFSMDGDVAPLIEIVALCEAYNAFLVVDDAHGLGVLGESGAGLLEELGLNQKQVPLLIGTFGKSFGASGAFVSGGALHVESFVQKARTYIYTTAILPALAVTITRAIDLVINSNSLRQHLNNLIINYNNLISESGLYVSDSRSHIQPFIVGGAGDAVTLSEALYENNILAVAIRPPTVPKGTSRLRLSITAAHTQEQVARLVTAIKNNFNEN
jgi:8-amino-7-oxononanoate synthase